MNSKALFKLEYGLFVLTAFDGGRHAGCIINTAQQLTGSPLRISVTVNKQNYTHDCIANQKKFNVSVLTQQCPFELITHFGFQSGRENNKFPAFKTATSDNGLYYLTEYSNAYISGEVIETIDLGTHTLFIADVVECELLSEEPSATYGYYHNNIKPKPAAAPTKRGWRCKICGYFHEGDLPEDFICPICKHPATDFEPVGQEPAAEKIIINNESESKIMKKYVCAVCGYVHEGNLPEDFACPICKAPASKFNEMNEGVTWADEHVVGVAKGVDQEIIDGLRENFNGECSEVGMYLAMSRVAFREGYPEIGLYWEKAAYEEAEHAAKFAELLGEVVTDSTKKNLEMRVAAESGACDGKKKLAARAKQLNLDAIHDTVHEMAKDEARHGKAFEGLLKRYFG